MPPSCKMPANFYPADHVFNFLWLHNLLVFSSSFNNGLVRSPIPVVSLAVTSTCSAVIRRGLVSQQALVVRAHWQNARGRPRKCRLSVMGGGETPCSSLTQDTEVKHIGKLGEKKTNPTTMHWKWELITWNAYSTGLLETWCVKAMSRIPELFSFLRTLSFALFSG